MKNFIIIFLAFILLSIQSTLADIILNVPFVKQKSEFCGPASLSAVFQYYGENINQDEIAKVVYNPTLKGALITDLEVYAKEKGFITILKQSDINEIKSFINRKIPVITLVDLGFWIISQPHYIVILGYNEKGFVIHTGYKEKDFLEYNNFEKKWEKMGKVILVVYK